MLPSSFNSNCTVALLVAVTASTTMPPPMTTTLTAAAALSCLRAASMYWLACQPVENVRTPNDCHRMGVSVCASERLCVCLCVCASVMRARCKAKYQQCIHCCCFFDSVEIELPSCSGTTHSRFIFRFLFFKKQKKKKYICVLGAFRLQRTASPNQ